MGKQDITTENILCAKCGKLIAKRNSDGSIYFRFGKKRTLTDEEKEDIYEKGGTILHDSSRPIVEMFVRGIVKMRCISHTCDHITIIFPSQLAQPKSNKNRAKP